MTLSGIATDDALVVFAKAADDEWRLLGATVLRTEKQRLAHVEASFLEGDGDAALAARIVCTAPLTGLSQGVVDAFSLVDNDFASMGCQCYRKQQ